MTEEESIVALDLLVTITDDLFDGEVSDMVIDAALTGIENYGLEATDSRLEVTDSNFEETCCEILAMEVLRGVWALARNWLETCYDLDNRREDILSMIYIIIGSASHRRGRLDELERYVQVCDRFSDVAAEQARMVDGCEFWISVARVVEASWACRVFNLLGLPVPDGYEEESAEFAIAVASIFSALAGNIKAMEAGFP